PACGPSERFWVRAEYLLWWIKDGNVPPLVSSGPPQSGAILGRPGVTTLLGGGIDQDSFSGARITAGLWLDCERTIGLEGGVSFLGTHAADFTLPGTGAPGSPALGRPFFNPLTGAEDSQLVSLPGQVSGSVRASLATELGGAEVNGLCNVCCGRQG